MASYESIFQGSKYLLEPNYQFTGYNVPASHLGGTTSIQTSNQLGDVNRLLNTGMQTTEVSAIQAEVFEMMPQDHLKEINRLNKLTGAESTLHAPIIDPAGFLGGEGGASWNEENREIVERQFSEFVKRGHDLDPKGNVPVTIHSSQIAGSELMPDPDDPKKDVYARMIAVDTDTGSLIPLYRQTKHYPDKPEGKIYTPEEELRIANNSHWSNQLSQVAFLKERGDALLKENYPLIAGESQENYTPAQRAAAQNIGNAQLFLNDAYSSVNSLFDKAYKASDEKGRERLASLAKQTEEQFKTLEESEGDPGVFSGVIQNLMNTLQVATHPEKKEGIQAPRKYVQIEEFATEKASKTLGNVAWNSYKKYKDTAPIISIENPPYGSAIATGKDLKKLVEESRKKFIENLVQKGGKSTQEAEKIAQKHIGVTWDTSHISMIRKQGFGKDRLVEEAKTIAPYVKHLHFNDNFGTTHTDLPPGMGDVPMNQILKEFEKEGFKGKKIFEGGNFVQSFGAKAPYIAQLSYSGSPLYAGGPQWNQLGAMGGYFSGHGAVNPQIHHTYYGAGFQNLPMELGGNIPQGDSSRFAGTPNA